MTVSYSSIEENSPAELGGVEKGDFIVSINGIRTCGLRNKTIVTLGKGLKIVKFLIEFADYSKFIL